MERSTRVPAEDTRIKIHGPDHFEGMRRAGRLAAETLDFITPHIKPGVSTAELDRLCHDFIVSHGAVPAPLNYRGFPRSIDVTTILDGWHGDTSRMFEVGEVRLKAHRLIEVTYEAMMRGIAVVRPGATTGDIGYAIQSFAEAQRYSIVRDFCGHGLGRVFHDAPSILHFGEPGEGVVLREGMFFTVEPMINAGKYAVKILGDGWTAVTKDRSLSAQFEHSVGVTPEGSEIFTLSPKGWHKPPYR